MTKGSQSVRRRINYVRQSSPAPSFPNATETATGYIGHETTITLQRATGNFLRYSITSGTIPTLSDFDATAGTFKVNPTSATTVAATIRVEDGAGRSAEYTLNYSAIFGNPPGTEPETNPPVAPDFGVDTLPKQYWLRGQINTYELPNPNGDPEASITITGGVGTTLPTGISISGRTITVNEDTDLTGTIIATATSERDGVTETDTVTLPFEIAAAENPSWTNPSRDETVYINQNPVLSIPPLSAGYPPATYTHSGFPTGAVLNSSDPDNITITFPTGSVASTHTGIVTANINNNLATYTINLTVSANTPPSWTYNASRLHVIYRGRDNTIHIPAADKGFPAATYTALRVPAGMVFNPDTLTLTGDPITLGRFLPHIIADNGINPRGSYTVQVLVKDAADIVWETAVRDRVFVPNEYVQLQLPRLIGEPIDGVRIQDGPQGLVYNKEINQLIGTITEPIGNSNEIKIIAFNTQETQVLSFGWRISVESQIGWLNALEDTREFVVGRLYEFTIPSIDYGAPEPRYELDGAIEGVLFDEETLKFTVTIPEISTGTIRVRARNQSTTAVYTIPFVADVERAPSFSRTSVSRTFNLFEQFKVVFDTADGFPTPTYRQTSGNFPGATYDPVLNVFEGKTTTVANVRVIEIMAENGVDNDTPANQRLRNIFRQTNTQVRPDFVGIESVDHTIVVGDAFSIVLPDTFRGNPVPTFAISTLPAGVTFTPATRTLTGTPTVPGTYPITLTATNSQGSGTYSFNLIIVAKPPVFSVERVPLVEVNAGTAIDYTPPQVSEGDPIPTYRLEENPPGWTYNASTNKIEGTESTPLEGEMRLIAENASGIPAILIIPFRVKTVDPMF